MAGAHQGYPGDGSETASDWARTEQSRLRVILRADAGHRQGTGHVMRMLTLGEALLDAGHEALLLTAELDVPWLVEAVVASGVQVVPTVRDRLDLPQLQALAADWVVVDSYLVPPDEITALATSVPVLQVGDGETWGARATLVLDQNLAAPPLAGAPAEVQLLGAEYALVRRAIRSRRIADPWVVRHRPPHVVVVLGGTDPQDRTVDVARACAGLAASFVFVAPARQHDAIDGFVRNRETWKVLGLTPALPEILAGADVVVSAGGTTAWDVATLGIPSLLLAVVGNQRASVAAAVEQGIALGLDVVDAEAIDGDIRAAVARLLEDTVLREALAVRSRGAFDGRGAERVVAELERHAHHTIRTA